MDLTINNIDDLRIEINLLKEAERRQSIALLERVKSPVAILSTIGSLFFNTSGSEGGRGSSLFDQDIVGLISRIVLPFTLNKTVFRNSGFLVKTLVSLVSQRASRFITEDGVLNLWDKAKGLFKAKQPEETPAHKGVPPLSETY